ncbi:winged helix-turn-helix transcriptional regulator [bacterium]|nr:winged helix-turn-helix transcriptional regulator [bacterium]
MDELTKIFKALSDKNRLRILKMLQEKSLCVCEITEILGLSTATVSVHLSLLKNAGLVTDSKDGRWVNYFLVKNPKTNEVASLLPLLNYWLNDDEAVKEDKKLLATVCRDVICCK